MSGSGGMQGVLVEDFLLGISGSARRNGVHQSLEGILTDELEQVCLLLLLLDGRGVH